MPSLHSPPPRPLVGLTDDFWLYTRDGEQPPRHTLERRLPDGAMHLIINLRDDVTRIYAPNAATSDTSGTAGISALPVTTLRGIVLSGPHTRSYGLDTAEQTAVLGVRILPGATQALFGLPADALRETTVSLEQLWGTQAALLRERVLAAPSPQARLAVVAEVLLERAVRWDEPCAAAVAWAVRAFEGAAPGRHVAAVAQVAQVAQQVGYSRRHFAQMFREAVGLAPSEYRRVRRFQAVVHALARDEHAHLAELAAACGYYDQAHLIHDFRAFSGLTPSAYLARPKTYANHLPLAEG